MADNRVFVVDDDPGVRMALAFQLEAANFQAIPFASGEDFLEEAPPNGGCLIADVRMPGMSGLDLLREISRRMIALPVIVLTGHGTIAMAVEALKAGAAEFLQKPVDGDRLLAAVRRALASGSALVGKAMDRKIAAAKIAKLTSRERCILAGVVSGHSNKELGIELGISFRTVEVHRAHIMGKLAAANVSELVRIAIAADGW